MRMGLLLGFMAVLALDVGLSGCAKNASERRAASPTLGERMKQDAVSGKVSDIGTKHLSIRDKNGELHRVRVDDNTKMDQVAIGDPVKAYISDEGYASTVQRTAP